MLTDQNSLLTTPNNSSVQQPVAGGGGSSSNNVDTSQHLTAGGKESPVRDHKLLSEAPRTPTPFKRALANIYQNREPLSRTVRRMTRMRFHQSNAILLISAPDTYKAS